MRSNSDQIKLQQKNGNAYLDLRSQEVTSPTVPPGFKAAAAAAAVAVATAAIATATAAARTSHKPYITSLNRNSTQTSTATVASSSTPSAISKEKTMGRVCRVFRPTATLHYMPPQQLQHGPLPPMQPPPPNTAPTLTQQPPPPDAAPPTTHSAAQLKKQRKGGEQREMRIGRSTSTVSKVGHRQKVPINSFTDVNVAQMENRTAGHKLPIAVMPSQQQYQLPTIKQRRANEGQLQQQQLHNALNYAAVHATCTSAQGWVTPVQTPNVHAPPPMPPMMGHIYANVENAAPKNWGSIIQARGRNDSPPISGIMPYAPPWHILGKAIEGRPQISWPAVPGNDMRPMGHNMMGRMPPPHPPPQTLPSHQGRDQRPWCPI